MDMPGRGYFTSSNANYRYGFNGKEKDKESPVQYDYGFRIYDPRLVRFKSIDPLASKYPELTPYQFASNSPIVGVDLDGREIENYAANQIVKNHGVAALNVIDYHHGGGPLVKGTYSMQIHGNVESFEKLEQAYTTDPAILHNPNNKWAQYDVLNPAKRTSNWGSDKESSAKPVGSLKIGDNMHIEISALLGLKLDIYVRFTDIQVTATSFNITASTLYGHTDAGFITFSGSINPNTGIINFSIHQETTSNVGLDPGYGRYAQAEQWKIVLGNVEKYLGGKTESKTVTNEVQIQDAKKGDSKQVTVEDLNTGITSSKSEEIK